MAPSNVLQLRYVTSTQNGGSWRAQFQVALTQGELTKRTSESLTHDLHFALQDFPGAFPREDCPILREVTSNEV